VSRERREEGEGGRENVGDSEEGERERRRGGVVSQLL